MTIEKVCPACGEEQALEVSAEQLEQWRNGAYAQDVFPHFTPDQRETLISGICPACWAEMFGADDEEESA